MSPSGQRHAFIALCLDCAVKHCPSVVALPSLLDRARAVDVRGHLRCDACGETATFDTARLEVTS